MFSLRDSGALAVNGGVCEVAEDALERATTTIPATLQGVIVSRIDRLPADEQLYWQFAGVIGTSFSPLMLAEVFPINIEAATLQALLGRLVATELLEVVGEPASAPVPFQTRDRPRVGSGARLVRATARAPRSGCTLARSQPRPRFRAARRRTSSTLGARRRDRESRRLPRARRRDGARNCFANNEAVKAIRKAFDLSSAHDFALSVERQARWEATVGHAWHELSDYLVRKSLATLYACVVVERTPRRAEQSGSWFRRR